MSQESPRLAELRRRVQADPASIAFAQLAEEYRRAGHHQEAVKYCRTGLARHPSYLSARVTLGRALMELGELDDAAREFDLVIRSAPDNFAAIRAMAEIHHRRGALETALDFYKRALTLARFDPELEETVQRIGREIGRVNTPDSDRARSFDETTAQFMAAKSQGTATRPPAAPHDGFPGSATSTEPLIDFDAILASLGVPDAAPPPIMEALLSERTPAATVPVEFILPSASEGPADNPFAQLEAELRQVAEVPQALHVDEAAATISPAAERNERARRFEMMIVEELEAWLRVLNAERHTPPGA